MFPRVTSLRMSNGYDRKLLNQRFVDLEEELSQIPEIRHPNDHVLLIDGLKILIEDL